MSYSDYGGRGVFIPAPCLDHSGLPCALVGTLCWAPKPGLGSIHTSFWVPLGPTHQQIQLCVREISWAACAIILRNGAVRPVWVQRGHAADWGMLSGRLCGAAFHSVLFGRGALIFMLPLQLLMRVVLPLSCQAVLIFRVVFMSQRKTGSSKNWCHEILDRLCGVALVICSCQPDTT